MNPAAIAAALCLLAGCSSAAADHERLGDAAYAGGKFEVAVAEYRAAARAAPGDRIWAKLGESALHARDYRTATDAYRKLAGADRSRAGEAADGIDRAARAADEAGDIPAVHEALLALRVVAPNRSVGHAVVTLARSGRLSGAEAVTLLPYAIAAAPDAAIADSLLLAWAVALQQTTACDGAVLAYQATLRRTRDLTLRKRAGVGIGECSLQLGFDALGAGRPDDARDHFLAVLAVDSLSVLGRRASLGLADIKVKDGDLLGAVILYEKILSRATDDSVAEVAREQLRALGNASLPLDSLKRTP